MGLNEYKGFISNGEEISLSSVKDIFDIEEHEQVFQADGCICTNKEHGISCQIVHVGIPVKTSKKTVNRYVVEMGFCRECNAYYIPQKSYEYLANHGEVLHQIVGGVSLYKPMTYGTSYNEEKRQLEVLEKELEKESIKYKPTVSKYQVDDGCGGLYSLQSQKEANADNYIKQEEIEKLKEEPYIGRIDLQTGNNNRETYYIGKVEDKVIGSIRIHSSWSEVGMAYMDTDEPEGIINSQKRKVDLRRKINIRKKELKFVEDVFYSNTEYAEKGIYDRFLIEVLMSRKKSHQLTDIIATIQKEQRDIISKAYLADIIVQGCAGSGKTMVMLHRLSYWLYNNKSLNPDKIKILTPNENFNLHIGGLHSQLKLGSIEVLSIEQYYLLLLKKYDKDFGQVAKIEDENDDVDDSLINFVYQKQFEKKFRGAFKNIISEYAQDQEIGFIKECLKKCNLKNELSSSVSVGEKVQWLTNCIYDVASVNKGSLDTISRIRKRLDSLRETVERNENFAIESQEIMDSFKYTYKQKLSEIVSSSIQETYVNEERLLVEIKEVEDNIDNLNKGIKKIFNGNKIRERKSDLDRFNDSFMQVRDKREQLVALSDMIAESTGFDEIYELISQKTVLKEDKAISQYIAGYRRARSGLFDARAAIDKNNKEISSEEKNLEASNAILKTEESDYLLRLMDKYPKDLVITLFKESFRIAIEDKLKELGLKKPEKTYRYELYARLLFAELFWQKTVGEDEIICIDEGQDMSFCEYERIITQNKKNSAHYNIYGDLNQRIKMGRGLPSWEHIKKELLATEYELNENYRNTNQITQYCNDEFGFNMTLTGVEGEQVKNLSFDEMLDEISENTEITDRIAIIIPRSMSKQKITRSNRLERIKGILSTTFDTSKISVVYIDEIKGIEFDRVYVCAQDMARNEKYIAYTRALEKLIIVQ